MSERRDIGRLQAEIEELFSDLWQVPRFTGSRHGFRPAVDCYRTEDPPLLTLVVELPGVDPAGVEVVAVDRAVVVSGVRRRPQAVQGQIYQQIEIEYGRFQRHIPLSVDVDTSAAKATYDQGLLTVVLPIAERPKGPVQVPVDVRS